MLSLLKQRYGRVTQMLGWLGKKKTQPPDALCMTRKPNQGYVFTPNLPLRIFNGTPAASSGVGVRVDRHPFNRPVHHNCAPKNTRQTRRSLRCRRRRRRTAKLN